MQGHSMTQRTRAKVLIDLKNFFLRNVLGEEDRCPWGLYVQFSLPRKKKLLSA